jgi:hypothetical protein
VLTYDQKRRILIDATLGKPLPENATEEERAWRAECDRDVAAAESAGQMIDPPFDWDE